MADKFREKMKKFIIYFFLLFASHITTYTFIIKITGGRFKEINPISWSKVFDHYLEEIILFSFFSSILMLLGYIYINHNNKGKNSRDSYNSSNISKSDSVLNKIIEDALNGKRIIDDLDTKADNIESQEKEDNNLKD